MKIGKNIIDDVVLLRQADFGKIEVNDRNHGGNCQRFSVKSDQFEINAAEFLDLRAFADG